MMCPVNSPALKPAELQMERANLCEETFIAQHHVTAVRGVIGVALTNELASCSAARGRYSAFLEKMQKERLSATKSLKSNSTVNEIDLLKSKRCRLEKDIGDLTKCADDFSERAEQDRDFGLSTQSNAMHKSALQKATQQLSVQSDLDRMMKGL